MSNDLKVLTTPFLCLLGSAKTPTRSCRVCACSVSVLVPFSGRCYCNGMRLQRVPCFCDPHVGDRFIHFKDFIIIIIISICLLEAHGWQGKGGDIFF